MALLLRLPAFFFMVWLMYWSFPLGILALYTPVWNLWGPRNDTFYWVKFLIDVLGIRFRKLGNNDLYRGPGPIMFLANHRSWADFFVDSYLSGGRAQMLSRMAVLYAFPMFMLPVVFLRGCIVFKRGPIRDKEVFNRWIDKRLEESPQAGLMVYPEGHRSTKPHSLPLKRGMLHYAYSRKLPIQIIMSGNKEAVLSEKEYRAGYGCTVVTSYSDIIRSSDYPTFDAFMAALQAAWDEQWTATLSADAAGLPVLKPDGGAGATVYPPVLQASQVFWFLVSAPLMVLALALAWRGLGAALALTVGAQGTKLALAVLLGYAVASFAYCYDTSLPRPRLLPDGSVNSGKAAAAANGKGGARADAAGAAGGGDEARPNASSPSANGLHSRR